MKKNFKPNTWLYPQPVLVIASYDADGTADGMVAPGAGFMIRTGWDSCWTIPIRPWRIYWKRKLLP